jgi:cytochrome oxidase assembly protein ShyY1
MPAWFSAFGRVFSPTWPMTLATLVLLGAFLGLGRWQWQRGEAKEAVWAEYERDAPASQRGDHGLDNFPLYSRVAIRGSFVPERQFLLDNRSHKGRPGYEVPTLFVTSEGHGVLVNRGWVPFTGYRDRLPEVTMKDARDLTITGRIANLPAAGLASGRAAPEPGPAWPKLTSFPTYEELQAVLGGTPERRILLLDPQVPGGYLREWQPPGLDPARHYSYAIQWWGFALVLLVLYFSLNFRRVNHV